VAYTASGADRHIPAVRHIGAHDVVDALRLGLADFAAMPTHAVFLSIIYPIVGLILVLLTLGQGVLPLLFPIAAGFALIGPFAALALYELSRRREKGMETSWREAFAFVHAPAIGGILALGLLLLLIFLVWVATANAIHEATFGFAPAASIPDFLEQVFFTPEGRRLILIGNGVGFLFALMVLVISVVSFPLLLDRNVSPIVAIMTSVRAVAANPIPMALWGAVVAVSLFLGSLPFFVGLAVVLPVLGHASWHLYRKVIAA